MLVLSSEAIHAVLHFPESASNSIQVNQTLVEGCNLSGALLNNLVESVIVLSDDQQFALEFM